MTTKELVLWYYALCKCIRTDDYGLIISEYFWWADDLYNEMTYDVKQMTKRNDDWWGDPKKECDHFYCQCGPNE